MSDAFTLAALLYALTLPIQPDHLAAYVTLKVLIGCMVPFYVVSVMRSIAARRTDGEPE